METKPQYKAEDIPGRIEDLTATQLNAMGNKARELRRKFPLRPIAQISKMVAKHFNIKLLK